MLDKVSSMNRREFVVKSMQVAGAGLLPPALMNAALLAETPAALRPYQPVMDRLPARPREQPLNWRSIADAFNVYVCDPANGLLKQRADGNQYFLSATGDKADGGLTTFAPLVLGKALRGDDVAKLLPSLAPYFHESAGIFLDNNTPEGAKISEACEYWYLMNVNSLAAGLTFKALPQDSNATERIRKSADRLIALAHQVDYDFNAQGYNFTKNGPWTRKDIYRQPDSVGGYAYLMVFAHEKFGDAEYLSEAKAALAHYLAFQKNPWYEIPNGSMACLAAARLSAHHRDPDADFRKALGFVLDPDNDCLRTGEWGGREVNGLMGGWGNERLDANPPHGLAYSMESMVTLPYVLPTLRYDPRYATDIGKFVLNAAANMRLFYTGYLPPESQSSPGLTPAIPYERLDETLNGHSPYASGDFAGHRSVYGGAYCLWLSEMIHATEDPFILQLDLAKTDFLAKAAHPTYLNYNPWPDNRRVTLKIASGKSDVYDLQAHKNIRHGVEGAVQLEVPAQGALVLAITPSGRKREFANGVMSVGDVPVDYQASSRT